MTEAASVTPAEPEVLKETTMGDLLDAIKELTKTVATLAEDQEELAKQIELSRKAGKF